MVFDYETTGNIKLFQDAVGEMISHCDVLETGQETDQAATAAWDVVKATAQARKMQIYEVLLPEEQFVGFKEALAESAAFEAKANKTE